LVQKLVDNDIPPNEIIQITGHKNVNSLNNYSSLSDKKQQQIFAVLSNAASTSQSLSAVSIEENTKAESFLSGATPGGGVLLGIFGGGVPPASPDPIQTQFQTKKCHFPHPFSDLASKIHTRFQT